MRSTDDEPMTLAERYSSAVESSNLRLKETRGDLDLIIAVGVAAQGPADDEDDTEEKRLRKGRQRDEAMLAAMLMRLLVEFDLVRGDYRAAELQMRQREAEAKRAERKGWIGGVSAAERAERIMEEAEAAALTAHVLILSQLSSLRDVKALFRCYAIAQATRLRFMQPDAYVLKLAGQVLDVFISPTCRHCHGRGFFGSLQHGEKQTICRPCKGSGNRRDSMGKDEFDRRFANQLLMQTSSLLAAAEAKTSGQRRVVAEWKLLLQEAERDQTCARKQ